MSADTWVWCTGAAVGGGGLAAHALRLLLRDLRELGKVMNALTHELRKVRAFTRLAPDPEHPLRLHHDQRKDDPPS